MAWLTIPPRLAVFAPSRVIAQVSRGLGPDRSPVVAGSTRTGKPVGLPTAEQLQRALDRGSSRLSIRRPAKTGNVSALVVAPFPDADAAPRIPSLRARCRRRGR